MNEKKTDNMSLLLGSKLCQWIKLEKPPPQSSLSSPSMTDFPPIVKGTRSKTFSVSSANKKGDGVNNEICINLNENLSPKYSSNSLGSSSQGSSTSNEDLVSLGSGDDSWTSAEDLDLMINEIFVTPPSTNEQKDIQNHDETFETDVAAIETAEDFQEFHLDLGQEQQHQDEEEDYETVRVKEMEAIEFISILCAR